MHPFESKNSRSNETLCPEDVVTAAFSRCQNYPKERAGVLGLAQGLARAAQKTGVKMEAIVLACCEISTWCPTDADMLNVARGLAPQRPSETMDTRRCMFSICDGSGWRACYSLHTHHVGEGTRPTWVDKQHITEAQYEELSRKVDWKTQMVYSARYRCRCHPARDSESEPQPQRRSSLRQISGEVA